MTLAPPEGPAPGWYDQGGLLPPGLSLALNTTGRAEVVRPGSASHDAAAVISPHIH